MTSLDQLVLRARAARVADEEARVYVSELHRWARVSPPATRGWTGWWIAGAVAVAAAAAIVLLVGRREPARLDAVRIGERVAVVAENSALYRVARADAAHTEIDVDQGTVSVRLFHGDAAHQLTLAGGGVRAIAVGTIYSLSVVQGQAVVEVQEGTVRVLRGRETFTVGAGAVWPPSASRHAHAGPMLGALAALPSRFDADAPSPAAAPGDAAESPLFDAGPGDDALQRRVPSTSPQSASPGSAAPVDDARHESVADRWRRARLLRAQGDVAAAVSECLAIADARDGTWSPIALLEAARIELGPRASPERAIELTERLVREWSEHQLVPEARELRCRALRQLGRDAECAGH